MCSASSIAKHMRHDEGGTASSPPPMTLSRLMGLGPTGNRRGIDLWAPHSGLGNPGLLSQPIMLHGGVLDGHPVKENIMVEAI
jgi:hypothetical protein